MPKYKPLPKHLKAMPCLHLNAGHDSSGNPKRLYILLGISRDSSPIRVAVIDEGYKGESIARELSSDYGYNGYIFILDSLEITKRQYRETIKQAKKDGIFIGS